MQVKKKTKIKLAKHDLNALNTHFVAVGAFVENCAYLAPKTNDLGVTWRVGTVREGERYELGAARR
jgi:hypothetical protein